MDNMNVSDMLSKIMADPKMMEGLKNTAQSLFGSGIIGSGAANDNGKIYAEEPDAVDNISSESAENIRDRISADNSGHSDSGGRSDKSGHSGSDSDKNKSERGNIENEQRIQLLSALKPYMDEERREKIDYMLRILKLFKLSEIGSLLKNLM